MIRLLLGIALILAIVVAIVLITGFAVSQFVRSDKKSHGTSGTLSAGALEVQSLLEPSRKATVDTLRRAEEDEEEDATGDPPEKA
jgi:hypothetical protein